MPIYTSRDSSESHGHMELLSLLSYQKYQAHCRLVFFTCSLCLEHSLADICMDQSQPPSALCSNVIFLGRAPSLLLNGTEPSPSTYHPITTLYYSPAGSSLHGIFHTRILSGLPCPPPGNLPISEIELVSPVLASRFFATCHLESTRVFFNCLA